MFQKKVLTINRDTGEKLYSYETDSESMTEERYYRPFVDLYKECIKRLERERRVT